MKKLLILILTCNVFYGQTYNDKFLDGTIIFKLKNFVEISEENVTNTDNIGVIVDLKDYPERLHFEGINVINFERPSYFSGKENYKNLQNNFSNYNEIDFLIDKLNKLEIIEYAEKEPPTKQHLSLTTHITMVQINGIIL